jgi:hypothetical protein
VTVFSAAGSVAIDVSSANGITGSFAGSVCIIGCASASATLRSDGRLTGRFQLGPVDADWVWYMASGGVGVDFNRNGVFTDLGDILIGSATSADTTPPTLTAHANVTVRADLSGGAQVLVFYSMPTAADSGIAIPVACSPRRGASFAAGLTTVTCTAVDQAGNSRTRTFTVNVINDPTATTPTTTNGTVVIA